jgi:hypothetical protein
MGRWGDGVTAGRCQDRGRKAQVEEQSDEIPLQREFRAQS